MKQNVFRLTVDPQNHGERLDRFLAGAMSGFSRGQIRRIIDIGGVHLDGSRQRRCGQVLNAGSAIEVFLDDGGEPFVLDESLVLFRDGYLIAINKPAGVATQPTPARYKGTLYEALLNYLSNPNRPLDKPGLGMVQRLDRDTSGLLVFSIHPKAHGPLTRQFAEGQVTKRYLAMVRGGLAEPVGEFRSTIARKHSSNLMTSVARGGKLAITRYRVLASWGDADLVAVEIPTGRSHQIRLHFSEAGHPLLGDARYGGPSSWRDAPVPRQMLHAWQMQLRHPVTQRVLTLTAPLPEDLERLLRRYPCNGGPLPIELGM